jgi:hypothetical protein
MSSLEINPSSKISKESFDIKGPATLSGVNKLLLISNGPTNLLRIVAGVCAMKLAFIFDMEVKGGFDIKWPIYKIQLAPIFSCSISKAYGVRIAFTHFRMKFYPHIIL